MNIFFMNEEVEIKVRIKDADRVCIKNVIKAKKKLSEIAKFIETRIQKDEYFVPRDKDYFKETLVVEYLRIRSEKNKNSFDYHFCHKDKNKRLLKSDEYETEIKNPEMLSKILKKVGMISKVVIKKERNAYAYGDFEIVIDNIDGLGYFIEVEAKKIIGDIEKTRKKCYEILKMLDIEYEDVSDFGYPQLVMRKK